ncbi:hypothetical protein F2Q68_00025182 [Brassica cretica]|uniref:Uncharacterized protein n=1 Tax=Brassica cretica TaxID=69181 RepID=A0A8S9IBA5_BRACR|nr:hypothetical protein F2Q68_00025182 [Brassica cretica]
MLTPVKDSHSVKVSKLEVAIGELEGDLGKTASSLLKEKTAKNAKSSEVRHLQRQSRAMQDSRAAGFKRPGTLFVLSFKLAFRRPPPFWALSSASGTGI